MENQDQGTIQEKQASQNNTILSVPDIDMLYDEEVQAQPKVFSNNILSEEENIKQNTQESSPLNVTTEDNGIEMETVNDNFFNIEGEIFHKGNVSSIITQDHSTRESTNSILSQSTDAVEYKEIVPYGFCAVDLKAFQNAKSKEEALEAISLFNNLEDQHLDLQKVLLFRASKNASVDTFSQEISDTFAQIHSPYQREILENKLKPAIEEKLFSAQTIPVEEKIIKMNTDKDTTEFIQSFLKDTNKNNFSHFCVNEAVEAYKEKRNIKDSLSEEDALNIQTMTKLIEGTHPLLIAEDKKYHINPLDNTIYTGENAYRLALNQPQNNTYINYAPVININLKGYKPPKENAIWATTIFRGRNDAGDKVYETVIPTRGINQFPQETEKKQEALPGIQKMDVQIDGKNASEKFTLDLARAMNSAFTQTSFNPSSFNDPKVVKEFVDSIIKNTNVSELAQKADSIAQGKERAENLNIVEQKNVKQTKGRVH